MPPSACLLCAGGLARPLLAAPVLGVLGPRLFKPNRPALEASLPTASCRLLTLKPKKPDDNIARDRAGSAANYHVTFWLSPAWGDHKKLIHVDKDSFKCGPLCGQRVPPTKAACWVSAVSVRERLNRWTFMVLGVEPRFCRGGWSGRHPPCGSQEPRVPGRVCDSVCGGHMPPPAPPLRAAGRAGPWSHLELSLCLL